MNRAVVVLLLLIANAIVSTRVETTTDTPSRPFREWRTPSPAGGEKPPRKVVAPFYAKVAPGGSAASTAGEQLGSRRCDGGFDVYALASPSSTTLIASLDSARTPPGCGVDRLP
jgi:hypothetical protein